MSDSTLTIDEFIIRSSDLDIGMCVQRLHPRDDESFALLQPEDRGVLVIDYQTIDQVQELSPLVVVNRSSSEPFAISKVIRAATRYISTRSVPPMVSASTTDSQTQLRNQIRSQIWKVQNHIRLLENSFLEYLQGYRQGQTPNLTPLWDAVAYIQNSVHRYPGLALWATNMPRNGKNYIKHGASVCIVTLFFAERLNIKGDDLIKLGLAGLLHDIGELCLPENLMNTNREYLAEDRKSHRFHIERGVELLKRDSQITDDIIKTITEHHEWVNGQGYPQGLKDFQLGQWGKLLAITDAYVGMTHSRVVRRQLTTQEAMEEIVGMSGSQFDQHLAHRFVEFIGIFPEGTLVELNTGEIGLVLNAPAGLRLQPKVAVVSNNEQPDNKPQLLDLSQYSHPETQNQPIYIERALLDGSNGVNSFHFFQEICEQLQSPSEPH